MCRAFVFPHLHVVCEPTCIRHGDPDVHGIRFLPNEGESDACAIPRLSSDLEGWFYMMRKAIGAAQQRPPICCNLGI